MAEKNSVDISDPVSIKGTREFDAPVALVFSAFTDPKHLSQWWGPDGFTTTTSSFEFKPGGVWRLVMHGPGGRDYESRIVFDEIVANERIAYHHGAGDGEPPRFRSSIRFEDLGGGRTRLIWHHVFPTAEMREFVVKEHSADKGLVQTLSRLAGYVEAMAK